MKGGKSILKEHIYTLNISDEHPNSITLPYIFSITPPITSLSFGLRHVASEDVKIHYSFTRETIHLTTICIRFWCATYRLGRRNN